MRASEAREKKILLNGMACHVVKNNNKAGKLQTGNTFPKQYWLAVHGKPKNQGCCC